MLQAGTRDEERSVFGQFKKIERRHCPTRTAEKNQITARTQNIQVARESVLAHAVVNNVHPLIAGQPFRFGLKILFGIDDYFISTRAARELRFFFRTCGGDYASA